MTAWLMSIVGVVAVGVLLDILIPEGEINKYIRGVFGIVVVLVIVSPIPKLLGKGINLDDIMGQHLAVDDTFVQGIQREKLNQLEKKCLIELNKKIPTIKVKIYQDYKGEDIESIKVYLDTIKLACDKEQYRGEIEGILSKLIKINQGMVRLYDG